MSRRSLIDLLALAALWGASFLFMRLGAADFGPVALACLRVALASAALLPIVWCKGLQAPLRQHARTIALVGVVNSALPFLAFAYAALYITAGLSSIFNATAPLWGALIGWLWLSQRPGRWRLLGLALGFAGVLWLAWDKAGFKGDGAISGATGAVLACLAATACYGWASHLTQRHLGGVPPLAVAAGSQLAATIVLLIPAALWWPTQMPGTRAWLSVLVLGLACTGLAYLLYFRLIAQVGPAKAISVTFLIPLFAVLWGWIFLAESLTPVMAGGCAVIVLGTALSTGLLAPRAAAGVSGGGPSRSR
ncbi:MAG: DMT family transporter [Rubrivivax sp.]|nr:DMT family transporter [Rubrivivax sp.]